MLILLFVVIVVSMAFALGRRGGVRTGGGYGAGNLRPIWVPVLLTVVALVLGLFVLLRMAAPVRSTAVIAEQYVQTSPPQWQPPIPQPPAEVVEMPSPPVQVVQGSDGLAIDPSVADESLSARAESETPPPDWEKTINARGAVMDPFTSAETLRASIVERVAAQCDKVAGAGKRRVISTEGEDALATRLAQQIGGTTEQPPVSTDRPADETWVTLEWPSRGERSVTFWQARPLVKGTLIARIAGPRGAAVVTGNLDEKPWLYEPLDARYLVSVSNGPQPSASQAVFAARSAAANALLPRARAELLSMPQGSRVLDSVFRENVTRLAQTDAGVADTCVVRVDRSYGPVWYAAQLRHSARDVARSAAANAVSASTERRQTWAGMILGLGGMTLALGLVYLALNAFTRGYFRGRLRVAVAVAAVLAVATMLALMG